MQKGPLKNQENFRKNEQFGEHMPIDQKYNRTRKRSMKIGYSKQTQTVEDKGVRRHRTTENPLVTWIKGIGLRWQGY